MYNIYQDIKLKVLECDRETLSDKGKVLQRCVGSMVGMAVADSLGHNFEFEHVQSEPFSSTSPQISHPGEGFWKILNNPYGGDRVGNFELQSGQWYSTNSVVAQ